MTNTATQTTGNGSAVGQSLLNVELGLLPRIEAHIRQLSPHMMQRDGVVLLREAKQELEILGAAIVAMAEDGWLYHGVEGMDDTQKKCYEAYLRVKPNAQVTGATHHETNKE